MNTGRRERGQAAFLALRLLLSLGALLGTAAVGLAQGVQTGIIRGMVKDQQQLPVPGASVTGTSSAMQGPRSATTDGEGAYSLLALPPGDYEVKFELSGFQPVTQKTTVPLGLTVELSVMMRPATLAESVEVVAETPAATASSVVGANFKHEEIEALANQRTISGIAQLSPALTENGPNVNQLVINGAFAFDNIFMVNGVDINDNLFATTRTLFVEDAIEETQVLTSGISAEFGRFTGGVINAITRSGGNSFSGSGRTNFLNPSWTTQTPWEVSKGTKHLDKVSRTYEGTFGGPVMKDRLWFFAAGRRSSVDSQVTLPQTGIGLVSKTDDKRGEIKATGTVGAGHRIQGGFLNNPSSSTNNSGIQSAVIDPHSETTRSFPNWYYYTNYKGVSKGSLLVEAQYSARKFEFRQTGPDGKNLVTDSPFFAKTCRCIYNAPYFAGQFDPEQRNNRQLTGSMTAAWNLSGRHETKAGYEWFRSQRTGGNSQSPTQYVFRDNFIVEGGKPVLDSTGRPIPSFVNGDSSVEYYPALKGAVMNVDNNSLYVQDHWTINSRWSADLGTRYEHAKVTSTGGIVSINNNRIVPRLATAYDVNGNGDHVIHVTYGQYSGRYNEAQIGKNSPVGNPPRIEATYQGPSGQGYSFAPGFDLANYPITSTNASVSDPTKNVFVAKGTKSPITHEFTTSYGANLGSKRGYAEITYVYRKTTNMVEDFFTREGGFTNVVVNGVSAGNFTNRIYKNTQLTRRQYQGMVLQSRYRISNTWNVNGHYTLQISNKGNYEGEASNQPGLTSLIGDYPEAFSPARSYPDGRLQDFQRHRARIWSIYNWNMGHWGDVSFSGLWRVNSGQVYSIAALNQTPTNAQKAILLAAGYPDVPSQIGNHVFFGDRGSQTFKGYGALDTSLGYNIPVFRTLRPWVKLDVYNLFNNRKLLAWDTTVTQNRATVDNLGNGTDFTKGTNFGTATGNTVTNLNETAINVYPLGFAGGTAGGRTFRVATGFRF